MKTNQERITKAEFIRAGGLSNPRLFRKQIGSSWAYFRRHD